MSLIKLFLGGNNLVFSRPERVWSVTSRLGTGKWLILFYSVRTIQFTEKFPKVYPLTVRASKVETSLEWHTQKCAKKGFCLNFSAVLPWQSKTLRHTENRMQVTANFRNDLRLIDPH